MQTNAQDANASRKMLWAGRIVSALPILFLLTDGVMKLVKPAPVVEATVQLGYPETVIVPLGFVLLACTVLYSSAKLGIAIGGALNQPAERAAA